MRVLGTITVTQVFRVEASVNFSEPQKADDALLAAFHASPDKVLQVGKFLLVSTVGISQTPEEVAQKALAKRQAGTNED